MSQPSLEDLFDSTRNGGTDSDDTAPPAAEGDPQPEANAEPEAKASETPAPEPEAKPEAEAEPEQKADGQAEADDGDLTPDSKAGFKKALAASRSDTREAKKAFRETQQQLAQLQGELKALREMQAPKPEPAEDVDPDLAFLENPAGAVKTQIETVQAQMRQEIMAQRLAFSEMRARDRHEDYQQAEDAFAQAAKVDPRLVEQIRNHPDPAQFAYDTGKLFIEAESVGGDLGAWKKQQEEKIRAQVLAEMAGNQQPGAAPQVDIPKSNAGARGSGVGTSAAAPMPSLEELFDAR